jgi:predicted enzyme related to lactoylglutathione lyase
MLGQSLLPFGSLFRNIAAEKIGRRLSIICRHPRNIAMADQTARGHVVWHELLTPDAGASHGFYAKVLGWKSRPWEHNPSYKMFAAATGPLGGTVTHTEGPAHWRHYIEAPDLDATTEQAVGLGATVQTPPVSLPNGARYAVLADPHGATFALIASLNPTPSSKAPKRGEYSWMELATTDVKAALAFYGELFGWEISQEHDMGPLGIYYILKFADREFAGAYSKPAEMRGPSNWLGYVRVKSVDSAVRVAQKAGATLVNGPMEVPGGDRIAQLLDPHGALFAVHMLASDVKPTVDSDAQSNASAEPATIEVTGTPREERKEEPAVRARKAPARKTQSRVRPKKKSKPAAVTKRKASKSVKRSARKAARVGSRTSKSKSKAVPARKKAAAKPKSRAAAKARKGK